MAIKSECGSIGIALQLPQSVNDKLTKSAKRWGRSKRIEAEMRLADHFERYPDLLLDGLDKLEKNS
jgi:hypothetical protein